MRPRGAMEKGGTRYGLFLRPSPALAARTLLGFDVCARQFGFVAASAYPPHITILGSIDPVVPEDELVAALDGAIAATGPMALHAEPLALDPGGTYLGHGITGPGARELTDLMGRVLRTVSPLRRIREGDFGAADRHRDFPRTYRPHLTVLGHDGAGRADELEDVLAFLGALGLAEGMDLRGDAVVLHRLASADWQGRYWETLRWEVLRTWHLGG